MNEVEKYEKLDEYMLKNNVTLEGYLKVLGKRNTTLLNLSEEAYSDYKKCFEYLKKDIDKYNSEKQHLFTAQQRGKLLEKMAGLLFFNGNAIFNKTINCRTVTNVRLIF